MPIPDAWLSASDDSRTKKILNLAVTICEALNPLVDRIEIAGSIRRKVAHPKDIDIVLIPKSDAAWDELIENALRSIGIKFESRGSLQIRATSDGIGVDIWRTTEDEWGAALMFATGPNNYNIAYRAKAKRMGLKLNRHGLFDRETGRRIAGKTEASIFKALRPAGYKPPEERGK